MRFEQDTEAKERVWKQRLKVEIGKAGILPWLESKNRVSWPILEGKRRLNMSI
jgi:hypothetical protein